MSEKDQILRIPVEILTQEERDHIGEMLTGKLNSTENPSVKTIMEDQLVKLRDARE
jgi:hypothetical protein